MLLHTYIFDLFYGEVGISRHTNFLRLDVDNDQKRIRSIALEKLVDFQI